MVHFEVIRGASGAASLKVKLKKGEAVKAEYDALIVKSEYVEISSKLDGGFLQGLGRSIFTGESIFFQTMTATHGDLNEVLLAAAEVGDICLLELRNSGGSMLLQKGAFLAADVDISVSSTVQSGLMKGALSGAGFFVLEARGSGVLAVSAFGSILSYDVKPGEKLSVDNGHLVAWSRNIEYHVAMASKSLFSSMSSGEGLMCHFTGPGKVYVQTHKPHSPPKSKGKKAELGNGGPLGVCIAIVFLIMFISVFIIVLVAGVADH